MKKRILSMVLAVCMVLALMVKIQPVAKAENYSGRGHGGRGSWELDTDTGIFTVNGMGEADLDNDGWYRLRDFIREIYVNEGVTRFGRSFTF